MRKTTAVSAKTYPELLYRTKQPAGFGILHFDRFIVDKAIRLSKRENGKTAGQTAAGRKTSRKINRLE
jgi:hypothetical protein